jgi:hypothetical protein
MFKPKLACKFHLVRNAEVLNTTNVIHLMELSEKDLTLVLSVMMEIHAQKILVTLRKDVNTLERFVKMETLAPSTSAKKEFATLAKC